MSDFNSQGFRVLGCFDVAPVKNVAAQFLYRGYEVSMSTMVTVGPVEVAVYLHDDLVKSCYSVAEAIDWILEATANDA